MELVLSYHALEQARERGVSINEIKEVIQKASGQNYFYRERFLKNTITYLEGIADNDPLYRADPQSRNLIRTAVSIIRQL